MKRLRRRPTGASILGLPFLLGCATLAATTATPLQLQPQQIIVVVPLVTPDLRAERAKQLARDFDLERVGAFPLASIDVHCIVFEVEPGRDVDRLLAALASHPGVRLAQRNQRFDSLTGAYSDPYASLQHGAETLRARSAHRWVTGKGVRVGLVDTGVDDEHPDLAGRIVETHNFVEGGDESFRDDGHGTAVAGVIGARADNAEGIFGIAPDAAVLALKACWHVEAPDGPALCSSWTLARAIDFAIGRGVRVLNLSLGGPEDPLVSRVLAAADATGVVITAAAGDGAPAPAFPASLDFVIAVAASEAGAGITKHAGRLVAAPGDEIITTAPGARYRFLSGSSLATAHVTGVVALLLEQDPDLSPAQVRELLSQSTRSGGRPGELDACAAVRRASDGSACP